MSNLERLRLRAERSFGGRRPGEMLDRVRAIVGDINAIPPTQAGRMAVSALEKLQSPGAEEPAAAELAALEFFISMTRPAPLVRGGRPNDLKREEYLEVFPEWPAFQLAFARYAASIGRVDRAGNLTRSEAIGTCFQVSDDLVLTNRHVVEAVSWGTMKVEAGMAEIRFQQEYGSFEDDEPVAVLGVSKLHPVLDAALLRIDKRPGITPLEWNDNAISEDTELVVSGYPVEDSLKNPLFVDRIYNKRYEVLRAAPGLVKRIIDAESFQHDCSTLAGNSGSPALELRTARVVGLHVGGGFLWSNDTVSGPSLREFATQ